MADRMLHLEIITPGRTLFADEVESFEAPGADGEFQILAGHTPFLSGLKIGHVYYVVEGDRKLIAISGGFCEMRENRAVILAHAAESPEEIDRERALEARKRAEARLERNDDESIDTRRAELALLRAINRISALGD